MHTVPFDQAPLFPFIMVALVMTGVVISFALMLGAVLWCERVNPKIVKFVATKILRRS